MTAADYVLSAVAMVAATVLTCAALFCIEVLARREVQAEEAGVAAPTPSPDTP